jgi:hypothetical protein
VFPQSVITLHGILIARSALEITLESVGDVEHASDVSHGEGFLVVDG